MTGCGWLRLLLAGCGWLYVLVKKETKDYFNYDGSIKLKIENV